MITIAQAKSIIDALQDEFLVVSDLQLMSCRIYNPTRLNISICNADYKSLYSYSLDYKSRQHCIDTKLNTH